MPKTIIKQEIPYQMKDGGVLVTDCPYLTAMQLVMDFKQGPQLAGEPITPKVGSAFCMQCKHHVDHLRSERVVICSYPITD